MKNKPTFFNDKKLKIDCKQNERSVLFCCMNEKQKNSLRGEALRNKVLETALDMFSERGYFNTSIHDIRKAAGVSIGAIYHHFESKEVLAESLYKSLLEKMNDTIQVACDDKHSCLEKCKAIIEVMFQLTMAEPKIMQFVLLAQHREYLPDEPPICSSKPFQLMKSIIIEGIKSKEVREIEPWVAATTMFGGALRMMGLQLDGVLDKPLDSYLEAVVESAWRGIKI